MSIYLFLILASSLFLVSSCLQLNMALDLTDLSYSKEPTILQVSLIGFLYIEYLVGN